MCSDFHKFYYSFLSPFNLRFQTFLFSVFLLIFIYFSNKKFDFEVA